MDAIPASPHPETPPDWKTRLAEVVDTMREMSLNNDAHAMVSAYGRRMKKQLGTDRTVSLSRRGLLHPDVRITRDTDVINPPNPWKDRDKLPLLHGGLLADLIYGNEPRLLSDIDFPSGSDPGDAYFRAYRTIAALPHYDNGEGINMVLLMWRRPNAVDLERLPEMMQMSSLFGRVTSNLVLKTKLEEAYRALDAELEVVAEIQRTLLPRELPKIRGVSLAASYQTSRRAGGDYYDLFPLPDGKWGILIADVSGHGTPAAVVMAITHAISHSYPGPPVPPGALLTYVNRALATRYTAETGNFVTAFYAIFDPATHELVYSSAGHNPPRVRRADGALESLEGARSLPLGILDGEQYSQHSISLRTGDRLLMYTDGITEAWNAAGDMFGTERLDSLLGICPGGCEGKTGAESMVAHILRALAEFAGDHPADDDRTLLALCIE